MSGRAWTPNDERQALLAHAAELMAQAQAAILRASLIGVVDERLAPPAFDELSGEDVAAAQRVWRHE